MCKGACIKRMCAVKNYSTNTIMKKKKQIERERRLRIWSFRGMEESKWIFQRLIKNIVEYSGRDPGSVMWNLQVSWF